MITTLNTIEILEISRIGIISSILVLGCGFFTAHKLVNYNGNKDVCAIVMFVLMIFSFLFGTVGIIGFATDDTWKNKTGRFQIEATISDDMPFNSIYDNYKIIEKRGDIYLLEPKVFDLQQEDVAE